MRLVDLGLVYLLVGAGVMVTVLRRQRAKTQWVDLGLALFLWPLVVPTLLGVSPLDTPGGVSRASALIEREHRRLAEALDAARQRLHDPALGRLLPSSEHLGRLREHLLRLDARVAELDGVLATDDFDLARAERKLRTSPSDASLDTIKRLQSLRDRALRERDDLLRLVARLRMQATALRFAEADDPTSSDVAALLSELEGRLDGVGAAMESPVAYRAT